MRPKNFLNTILLAIILAGCATTAPQITPKQVSQAENWGATTQVTNIRHLFFSGQPNEEALKIAKARDIEVVINLRHPSESNWDEEAVSKSLGLVYYNVPLSGKAPFSPAAIKEIDSLVKHHADKKILMHCSSGNRAAAWLAIHLVEQHNAETNEALAVANKAGITKEGIRDKVRSYISKHRHINTSVDADSIQ